VTLHHPDPTEYAGTSELHVVGDTMTLTTLYDRICATAAHLKTHGDQDPLGVRKARALAQLAGTPKTKLYLHLDADTPVGRAEKLGPATIAQIRDWVGHSRVTIQPVLHTHRTDVKDAHDPPARMRNQVILRDERCVFPHCQRHARGCDLDHMAPFDDTGPPGQTRRHLPMDRTRTHVKLPHGSCRLSNG
jgi:hypothetical protein